MIQKHATPKMQAHIALTTKDGEGRARDVDDSPKVRVDLPGELIRRHLLERA
jgi:hypothetical protein